MARVHSIDGVNIPFTKAEEAAQDAVEKAWIGEQKIRNVELARINDLDAKLADDSITFPELKELMRLRGN